MTPSASLPLLPLRDLARQLHRSPRCKRTLPPANPRGCRGGSRGCPTRERRFGPGVVTRVRDDDMYEVRPLPAFQNYSCRQFRASRLKNHILGSRFFPANTFFSPKAAVLSPACSREERLWTEGSISANFKRPFLGSAGADRNETIIHCRR